MPGGRPGRRVTSGLVVLRDHFGSRFRFVLGAGFSRWCQRTVRCAWYHHPHTISGVERVPKDEDGDVQDSQHTQRQHRRVHRPGPAVAKVLADAEREGHPEIVDADLLERAERADAKRSGQGYAGCTQAYPGGEVDWENERRLRAYCGEPPLRAPVRAFTHRHYSFTHRRYCNRGHRPGARRSRSRTSGGSRDGPSDEPEPAGRHKVRHQSPSGRSS